MLPVEAVRLLATPILVDSRTSVLPGQDRRLARLPYVWSGFACWRPIVPHKGSVVRSGGPRRLDQVHHSRVRFV